MKQTDSDTMFFYDNWIIPVIAEEYGIDESEAVKKFIFSQTYQMLLDEENKLFRESPLVLLDMYKTEQETGNPRLSTYIQTL